MPNAKSQKRHMRVSEERHFLNRGRKSQVWTFEKQVRESVEAKDAAAADAALRKFEKALDKAAKHNVIHANKAARKKSRLKKLVGSIS